MADSVINLDQYGPTGLAAAQLKARIADGEFNVVKTFTVSGTTSQLQDVLPTLREVCTVTFSGHRYGEEEIEGARGTADDCIIMENPEVTVAVDCDDRGWWNVIIATKDAGVASKWVDGFSSLLPLRPPPPLVDSFRVLTRFWSYNPAYDCGNSFARRIDTQPWSHVEGNYPKSVRDKVGRLVTEGTPESGGKLILFHGPPGTGKTRSIMSLMLEWAPWCTPELIMDPEKFFGSGGYMNDVMFSGNDSDRWRLLILEDSDQFMDVNSKQEVGQSMSRLLNIADGIIGQGLKVLTLITTNVPMEQFNAAAIRPGRCMANVEYPSFPASEAREWLTAHQVPESMHPTDPEEGADDLGLSLAEMYRRLSVSERVSSLQGAFGEGNEDG